MDHTISAGSPIPELAARFGGQFRPHPLEQVTGELSIHGAYLHIPFCFHKCHYCDFYSFVDTRDQQAAFTERMCAEIQWIGARLARPLETIFIGGGTPTLLRLDLWKRLLASIAEQMPRSADAEFTVEANPETVSDELADLLVAGGINRVSVGAQSFQPHLLKNLERWHEPANVGKSVQRLRRAGIENLNLDLIFAIPTQTLDEWTGDLETALALQPEHLSCYGLTYEQNTPLTAKLKAGRIDRVTEDLEASMYERTIDHLASAGFEHYEISNWCRPGRACRHNLLYWRNRNWIGLGPSAASHVDGVRWKTVPRLGDYLAAGSSPPVIDVEQLQPRPRAGEELMLRLRLCAGIDRETLEGLIGDDADRAAAVQRHLESGLLEGTGGGIRLTRRGLLLADTVLGDLL